MTRLLDAKDVPPAAKACAAQGACGPPAPLKGGASPVPTEVVGGKSPGGIDRKGKPAGTVHRPGRRMLSRKAVPGVFRSRNSVRKSADAVPGPGRPGPKLAWLDWIMACAVSEAMELMAPMARLISSEVADCCSAAVAMERTWSPAASTMATISPMAAPEFLGQGRGFVDPGHGHSTRATASVVPCWMPEMAVPTSLVAFMVFSADFLTSSATTAKPRPASPARTPRWRR